MAMVFYSMQIAFCICIWVVNHLLDLPCRKTPLMSEVRSLGRCKTTEPLCQQLDMTSWGFQLVMGGTPVPQYIAGWKTREHPKIKWMRTGDSPILSLSLLLVYYHYY